MTQPQLDQMTDSLNLGLAHEDIRVILDVGWNIIAKFAESHGSIANKDFGTI